MNTDNILAEYRDKYSEYLEMYEDPNEFLLGILAKKIYEQQQEIEYLERKLKNAYK